LLLLDFEISSLQSTIMSWELGVFLFHLGTTSTPTTRYSRQPACRVLSRSQDIEWFLIFPAGLLAPRLLVLDSSSWFLAASSHGVPLYHVQFFFLDDVLCYYIFPRYRAIGYYFLASGFSS
jgi:hypothetical protein